MARYAGGKTKKEKTADKRNRRLANREAKESIKWVLIVLAALVVVIGALVWMSSQKAPPKHDAPKHDAPEHDELVKMFTKEIEKAMEKGGVQDAMQKAGTEEELGELLKGDKFKAAFERAMEKEAKKIMEENTKT